MTAWGALLPTLAVEFGHAAPVYRDQTVLHPAGMAVLALAVLGVLTLPRRYALVPVLIVGCLIAPGQRLSIAMLDFSFLRILTLVGGARVLLTREYLQLTWVRLDTAVLAFTGIATVAFVMQRGTPEAVAFRLGWVIDTAALYLLIRVFIRDWSDLETAATTLGVLAIVTAVAFAFESFTQRNLFAIFGGVPESTVQREGRLRVQGPFPHPILAGCYWAAALPLIAAGWWRATGGQSDARARVLAAVGGGAVVVIVVLSASSTPILAVFAGLVGALAFTVRRHMRPIRWALLGSVVGLHVMMQAPVWHLLARANVVGGSTGRQRFLLIDGAIRHIHEWWLVGTPTTAHWGRWTLDVTNQYVLEAVRGGLGALIAFLVVLGLAFAGVGRIWPEQGGDRYRVAVAWGLGVAMFVHCCSFMAISYFGQTKLMLMLALAAIASLTAGHVVPAQPRPHRHACLDAPPMLGNALPEA